MATNAKAKTRQFTTHIEISAERRTALIDLLNKSLAACFDLYSQTKQAHWNVKGTDFYQLHELFDETAADVLEFVDMIAERATTLGGYALGTVRMAAGNSNLPEYPTDAVEGMEHVAALVDRFAAFAAHARQAIDDTTEMGDPSTADLYTEVSRAIDKRLWFLEAHLQGKK